MYHALYRKYRPSNFDSVVGQNTIIKTLLNSVKNNSLTHAYMFFGPRGTGKTTVSKIFARAVNCLESVDGNACGKCKNCLYSHEKECVDIIEIDAASNNGVDEIRDLRNKVSLVPAELKYKVYIIDEVHMLSIGAFNAFLKTLEEPPEHAIFILATTDPQKVPETIISRCQCFSFKRISDEMIVNRLKYVCFEENIDIDDDVLMEIAIASDGGMRDSLGMLDKLSSYSESKITLDVFAELNGMITTNDLNIFCNNLFSGDLSEVLTKINKFNSDGKNLIQIMSQIMHYLRNLLVDYYISNKELMFSYSLVQEAVNTINENMFDIKRSSNPKIFIEMLLIKFVNTHIFKKNISREIIIEVNPSETIENKENSNAKTDNLQSSITQNSSFNNSSVLEEQIFKANKNVKSDADDSDDEFDFSSYTGDNDEEDEFYNTVSNSENVSDCCAKILNLDKIMSIRVNNTLALANKQILNEQIDSMSLFSDYTFDQEIGYVVCSILDGKIRAASQDSIILSYEYDSVVKQNLDILDKITYVYNKITNFDKKIAIITDDEWEKEKNKYIKSIRDGNHYIVINEPEEIYEELKNDDIISSSAVELFGDIVEFE